MSWRSWPSPPSPCAPWLPRRIEEMGRPGQTNDYSFQGTENANIVGFDHALYRLGLRDRRLIRLLQGAAILAVGAWVARQVAGGRLPRGAACSLVALYSI